MTDLARGVDWITAQLLYSGPAVTVSGGWHPSSAYPFSMEYSIVADRGAVEYSSAGAPPALYAPDGSKTELPLSEKDGYQAEIEYFVDRCIEGRQPDLCPPVESARAVRVAGLMLESREKRGERIPWKSE